MLFHAGSVSVLEITYFGIELKWLAIGSSVLSGQNAAHSSYSLRPIRNDLFVSSPALRFRHRTNLRSVILDDSSPGVERLDSSTAPSKSGLTRLFADDARRDRLAELHGSGELRPVPGRKVDHFDVADPRKLGGVGVSL